MKKYGIRFFFRLFVIILSLLYVNIFAAEPAPVSTIPLDEVRSDMDAYCLTVFSGTQVERFDMKVLSVVRGYRPGQNMILVLGTDERFAHGGAIHGCSGSPVYIDGRLAGALAIGWDSSLDALYMVRPIEDMMQVGTVETTPTAEAEMAFYPDLSGPLNLKDIYQQSMAQLKSMSREPGMLIPLSSSLPSQVSQTFAEPLRQMGFMPVSAPGILSSAGEATVFEPGGMLAVVLCGGDISLSATGTVTDIRGDLIYGFGHPFRGQGPTSLPIASGIVHTVVASRDSSFKFSTPGPVLGTLEFDESFGVRGTIGPIPEMIPFTIRIDRENADPRSYNCFLAVDRTYTPLVLQVAINGAALLGGSLPPEHTVRYEAQVKFKDCEPLVLKNVTTGQRTSEVEQTLYSIASLALNNPFEALQIESIEADIEIAPGDRSGAVRAMDVSQTTVKPGQIISVTVTMMTFRSEIETAVIDFKVPETLAPDKYKLQVMGGNSYQRFVSNLAPQRFRAVDSESLMQALRRVTAFHNDGLYAVMTVPTTGIVIEQYELPQLPQTKMLLMQDSKRLRTVAAYRDWAENRIDLDRIVAGGAEIEITVEP